MSFQCRQSRVEIQGLRQWGSRRYDGLEGVCVLRMEVGMGDKVVMLAIEDEIELVIRGLLIQLDAAQDWIYY